jgi:hypothetical protein
VENDAFGVGQVRDTTPGPVSPKSAGSPDSKMISMTPPIYYRSQNGRITPIAEMHPDHLDRAVAKLQKTKAMPQMLAELQAEQKRRVG